MVDMTAYFRGLTSCCRVPLTGQCSGGVVGQSSIPTFCRSERMQVPFHLLEPGKSQKGKRTDSKLPVSKPSNSDASTLGSRSTRVFPAGDLMSRGDAMVE